MADVEPGSGEFGDLYVSSNHSCLGRRRPSRESEFPGDLAFVTAGRTSGELGILSMLSDDPVSILQRASHHAGVRDAVTIVGEHAYASPGSGHQPKLSQLDSVQSFADRPHRHDLRMGVTRASRRQMLGRLGSVTPLGARRANTF
jgi:hypothetical protein